MRAARRFLPHIVLLVLALGLAVGCNSKDSNPTAPGGGGSADVIIDILANSGSNSFSPSPDTVSVGQKVAWRNRDSMTHTATSTDGTTFNTGNIAPGATSAAITMTIDNTFPYHCTLHPTMTGTLVVNP